MKRKLSILVLAIAVILALSACGTKSQKDVVNDLNSKLSNLKGYKAKANMTLQVGSEPQKYEIDVWHNKPDYYKVNLKNGQKDQSQMILRNKEGVFVLTPALNKSYKFQSEWPKNSSQAYLYESLVKDILDDHNAKFKATKDQYVFETKTRYQNNKMLPYEEIAFNKKTLAPVSVKVMDTDRNVLVKVNFTKVEFNAKFDNNAFDTKKSMTSANLEVPVSGKPSSSGLSVKYPTSKISGLTLIDEKEVSTATGKRAILTYTGTHKSYTLIEEQAEADQTAAVDATPVNGDIVDLGFTIGGMTDHSLTWTEDGVDYMIASKNLTKNEMIEVASSVQEEPVK
jgi:outer membrane lipoprotein-sorting protein